MMAVDYADRASSGLLIAEAIMAMEGNRVFISGPGIHNDNQVAEWKNVTDAELPKIIEGFRRPAEKAQAAGFDGIEVHGANGDLLDSFLRVFGKRSRLLLKVIDVVTTVWGSDRVGVRISPLNTYNSMRDSDPIAIYTYLAEQLKGRNLALLHLMRTDFLGEQEADVVTPIRATYQGTLITNMGYSALAD